MPTAAPAGQTDSISIMDGFYSLLLAIHRPDDPLNPQNDGTNIVFSFQSTVNQPYSVQFKNELTDPVWITLQSLNGDGTVFSVTNDSTAPQQFYRVTSP